MHRLRLAFVLLLLGAGPLPAAELPQAFVAGTVVDGSGAAIRAATVIVSTRDGQRETTTDAAGRFVFDRIAPGPVTVTVASPRFSPVTLELSPPTTDVQVTLQPAPVTERIVVYAPADRTRTAMRTDTPIRDVPQAVSVISSDAIKELNMTSMADVVRYVPGISFAQGEGNRDAPVFRGNSSTSDFYVDGVRDDVQYYRDVYNVARVEALKGPNAMIFGRGGAGGVINRVQRVADWTPVREIALQTGSFDNRRLSLDLNQPLAPRVSIRLTGVYEATDTYRSNVGLNRHGVNPTISLSLGPQTIVRAGYEHFQDDRTADRGIPSYQGRPLATSAATFFGNAPLSNSLATVHTTFATVEHRFSDRALVRSRTSYGNYDKFYQNVFPGAVDAAGASVSLTGYNDATTRANTFNQTDVTFTARAGRIEHTLLIGSELGRQRNANRRLTAFFPTLGANVTTMTVPVSAPTTTLPAEFRAAAGNADNRGIATVGALYVQDQVSLTSQVQAVVGVRFDAFNVDVHNNRTNTTLSSRDRVWSPRLGLIYKPRPLVSIYGSVSRSFQPRAGEQLTSLAPTNEALEPETFRNYEVGLKWDFARRSSLTVAAYDLQRGNIAVTDPNNPAILTLVSGQRTRGIEVGASGDLTDRWNLLAAYAYQDGTITRSLSAVAPAGAQLPNLPTTSVSLWNRYDVHRRLGLGVGLVGRTATFTSTDNTVVMPGYLRADAAAFIAITARVTAQINVENVAGTRYYLFAHSNNNITPGSPRAVRLGLTTRF